MKRISTLTAIFVGMTAFACVDLAKAESPTVINFDRNISFNNEFAIKDRLKSFDVLSSFSPYGDFSSKEIGRAHV